MITSFDYARFGDSPELRSRDALKRIHADRMQKTLDDVVSRIELVKPFTAYERNLAVVEKQKTRQCPSHYIHGACDNGHHYAKELYCGAEWCPVCGQKDSNVHKRRFASFIDKARRTKHLGLMVIELPLSSRNKWRYRRSLEEVGKLVTSVINGNYEVKRLRSQGVMLRSGEVAELKAKYFDRGMRRYHYFGDVKTELEQLHLKFETITDDSCDDLPETMVKSNIHLNLLLDSGFIPKSWLKHIVYLLREALGEPRLIVNYGYTREFGRMVHMVKYTTRATFRDITWDEWLAGQLYGFRNMRSWGVWRDEYQWSLDDLPAESLKEVEDVNYDAITRLQESICYKDMLPIKWSSPRPIYELANMPLKQDLGAGYYELPDIQVPESLNYESDSMHSIRIDKLERLKRRHEDDIEQITDEMSYYGDILLSLEEESDSLLKNIIAWQLGWTVKEQKTVLPSLHKTQKGGGYVSDVYNVHIHSGGPFNTVNTEFQDLQGS